MNRWDICPADSGNDWLLLQCSLLRVMYCFWMSRRTIWMPKCRVAENYLKNYRGAMVMVTHDRYFLDSVCNRIVEVDKGQIYSYETNYSGYLAAKQEREDIAGRRTEKTVHSAQGNRMDAARGKGAFHQTESTYPAL